MGCSKYGCQEELSNRVIEDCRCMPRFSQNRTNKKEFGEQEDAVNLCYGEGLKCANSMWRTGRGCLPKCHEVRYDDVSLKSLEKLSSKRNFLKNLDLCQVTNKLRRFCEDEPVEDVMKISHPSLCATVKAKKQMTENCSSEAISEETDLVNAVESYSMDNFASIILVMKKGRAQSLTRYEQCTTEIH